MLIRIVQVPKFWGHWPLSLPDWYWRSVISYALTHDAENIAKICLLHGWIAQITYVWPTNTTARFSDVSMPFCVRKVPTTNLLLYKFLLLACIKHCELHTVSKSMGASSAGVWNSHNKFTVLAVGPYLKLFSFVLFVLPFRCRWRFPGNSANMCLNSTNTSLGKDRLL